MPHAFVCDVHIPPRLVAALRAQGFRATHVFEAKLHSAGDEVVWAFARESNAIVVSKDADFVKLAASKPGPSVIHVRTGNCSNEWLMARFFASLPDMLRRIDSGERIVLLR